MNRRSLLTGSACALALGGILPSLSSRVLATETRKLTISTRTLDINGKSATVYGLIGPDGKQGLTFNAGDIFDVSLQNSLTEPTMIHWHGLTPPNEFDGVPDLPMPLLKAGEARAYRFPVGDGGTHWMHAHTLQEQNLLAAPLIVRTAEDRAADEQEVLILLHDFSFTPAEELLANLKGNKPAHGGMNHDMSHMNMGNMGMNKMDMSKMMSGGGMMGGMDLNDIAYDAYLANDRTLDDPEVVKVEKGGRVRLRIINGATATGFTIDTGGLSATLIAVDGQLIKPVAGTQFPLAMGQRADIRLEIPKEGGAFPVLALREGAPERTGIILATIGAEVKRHAVSAEAAGPVLDLALERSLVAARPLAARDADRNYMVHLMGNMQGYTWAMAGDAVLAKPGERVEIAIMNMSMMSHPMHLHGHHFQVVGIDGERFSGAVRDTVVVPPMQTVTVAVDANNPAKAWAFHCHHLYHMASGMMTTFGYEA
ncbi:MAG: multicopper oxidase family protein [Rhizobiales bacterium]|nr:multicopper oxidase family protein [Hyphomicrobiales bacterium]